MRRVPIRLERPGKLPGNEPTLGAERRLFIGDEIDSCRRSAFRGCRAVRGELRSDRLHPPRLRQHQMPRTVEYMRPWLHGNLAHSCLLSFEDRIEGVKLLVNKMFP